MLAAVRNMLIATWALLAAGAAAYLAVEGLLGLLGDPWNFPGDPPFFDLLLYAAGVTTMLNAVSVAATTRWWPGPGRIARRASRLAFFVSVGLCCLSFGALAERHSARWAAVRQGIRSYGDRVAAAAGGRDRVLSAEEFGRLKARLMPEPVPVGLPGFGEVHLRMAHGVYPYVGVDFGHGANALFNPDTMECIYSD